MAQKTYIVTRTDEKGRPETIEVKAERAEQGEGTRVTFYNGDEAVGSFINLQGWHLKA